MSGTHPTNDLDTRVAELATGFAIGDLDEAELRELYDLLRDEEGNGERAAKVAWQTLGVVTNIRAQVSTTFQDTIRHRLAQESMSGRFTNALLKRLGLRNGDLKPVETPQAKAQLPFAFWIVAALIGGALLAGGISWSWPTSRSEGAVVTALHGTATIAGELLIPGATVDHRSLVVKPGSQVTLQWDDGTSVAIAGTDHGSEAVATVRKDELVLLRGSSWITGRRGFTLTLPDRRCQLASDDSAIAVQVIGQRGLVGVRRGSLTDERFPSQLLKEKMGSGPAGAFRWEWSWDALSGSLGGGESPASDWVLTGDITWHDLNDSVTVDFSSDSGISLRFIPGSVAVLNHGQEVQRLTLPGSPLLNMPLSLRQSEAKTLTVVVDELSLTVPLSAPIGGYRLHLDGGATVKVDAFHALPTPRPTVPVTGW